MKPEERIAFPPHPRPHLSRPVSSSYAALTSHRPYSSLSHYHFRFTSLNQDQAGEAKGMVVKPKLTERQNERVWPTPLNMTNEVAISIFGVCQLPIGTNYERHSQFPIQKIPIGKSALFSWKYCIQIEKRISVATPIPSKPHESALVTQSSCR